MRFEHRFIRFALALLLAAGGILVASLSASAQKAKLADRYKKWLDEEVVYLLSRDERELFLKLSTDEERDKFIERFWEIRNPTPGAPTNPFREEHYRRIQYANMYFGQQAATDGWRTDRGRVYILLGPPKQRDYHLSHTNLRPFEIWFYSSETAPLPPFFYIVFYQRDNVGDFRMYSPYFDGPEKLVTSYTAESGRNAALDTVQKAAGREVARTLLSLLPDEPVDWQGRASLQSDVLLSHIRDLANHPLYKAQIDQRRSLLESVTYRLIVAGDVLKVLQVALRGPDGNPNLHFMLQLPRPESFAVAQADSNKYYYSLNVSARVFGADNQLLFTQDRSLAKYLSTEELNQVKDKTLAYEGLLPLAPGKYKVEFLLTNLLRKTAFRVEQQVDIPQAPAAGLKVSELTPFSAAETVDPNRSGLLPFSAAGVKFTPELESDLSLIPGRDLMFFYQIWAPPSAERPVPGQKIITEYRYGRLSVREDSKAITDEVDRSQFDATGSLVNGKRIKLEDAPLGNYRLVLTVSDAGGAGRAFATLPFRLVPQEQQAATWHVVDEGTLEEFNLGKSDLYRGLCVLAQGKRDAAAAYFRQALLKNAGLEAARARLVDVYFADQKFQAVADLYAQAKFGPETEESTVLRIAESLERVGKPDQALRALEEGFASKPTSGPLCQALSAAYRGQGNLSKAAEYEQKAKSLTSPAPPKETPE